MNIESMYIIKITQRSAVDKTVDCHRHLRQAASALASKSDANIILDQEDYSTKLHLLLVLTGFTDKARRFLVGAFVLWHF